MVRRQAGVGRAREPNNEEVRCTASDADPPLVRLILGYVVGVRSLWGPGIGSAAASAGLRYGFSELSLKEMWAEALDANSPSVDILRRIGMRQNGFREQAVYRGHTTRYRQFSVTADESRCQN